LPPYLIDLPKITKIPAPTILARPIKIRSIRVSEPVIVSYILT
jgi:hypothetical protein